MTHATNASHSPAILRITERATMKKEFENITVADTSPMGAVACVAECIHDHMAGLMEAYGKSETALDLERQLSWGLITQVEFCAKFVAEWQASPYYKPWCVLEKARDAIIDNRTA